VRDPHKIATDDLDPGRYRLDLTALDEHGRRLGPAGAIALGELVVR
jgi:hypothetical protein